MRRLLIILTLSVLSFTSCESGKNNSTDTQVESAKATITNLDPVQFQEKSPNGVILDVRTPGEIAAGKISGSVAIDFYGDDFLTKVSELPKDKEIFIYCAVGARSSEAAELLASQGFTKVYHLSGGINAWAGAGLPISQE